MHSKAKSGRKTPSPSLPYTHSAAFATDQNSQIADWQPTQREREGPQETELDTETERQTEKHSKRWQSQRTAAKNA